MSSKYFSSSVPVNGETVLKIAEFHFRARKDGVKTSRRDIIEYAIKNMDFHAFIEYKKQS